MVSVSALYLVISFLFMIALAPIVAVADDHGGNHGGGDGHHDSTKLKLGRYAGQLEVSSNGKKINAVLDLFYAQVEDEYPKLKAILKLTLGGFGSAEYVSYVYENVLFDPQAKTISFEIAGQDLIISSTMLHGDMLMGKFLSTSSGASGAFDLYFVRSFEVAPGDETKPPTAPQKPGEGDHGGDHGGGGHGGGRGGRDLDSNSVPIGASSVQALSGEYRGQCQKEQIILQIETMRSRGSGERDVNPFAQNRIVGSWGHAARGNNLGMRKGSVYSSGTYDFFNGRLALSGKPSNLQCEVQGASMQCGACTLRRTSSFEEIYSPAKAGEVPYSERNFKLNRSKYALIEGTPEPKVIDGTYRGYLHHEHLNQYQPVTMNVVSFYYQKLPHSPRQLYLSGSAEVNFDQVAASSEKLTYRIDRRPWLYSNGGMVLEGTGEAFGVVKEWRDGLVILDWYSRNFGRVGTIELLKGELPQLPQGLASVPSITGTFKGGYSIELRAVPTDSTEKEPDNPYYPMFVSGTTLAKGSEVAIAIKDGVYDFYSGALTFENQFENYFFGKRVNADQLKLFFTGNNEFAYPIIEMKFTDFYRAK